MKCMECGREFTRDDPEQDVCNDCQLEYVFGIPDDSPASYDDDDWRYDDTEPWDDEPEDDDVYDAGYD